jgi:PAS domain S-box-containing protein
MSKRDRHLKQRLNEFSSPGDAADTQPPAPITESAAPSSPAAGPIGSAATTPADLSYLTAAIEQLPLPAYLKDREHTWVAVNADFARLIGNTPDALLGHSDKEQADDAWQLDDRVLDGNDDGDSEETTTHPDGTIRTRRTKRSLLSASGQDARYVMGVVEETTLEDLTARKQTEVDLLKFKQGLERSTTATFITDRNGIITYVNPAFETIYGFTRDEAVGQTPRIIKSGLIPPEQYQHFWETLLAGQTVAGELTNKAKDGRLIPIEGSNNPILDESGNVIGFLALHTDISARKQAADALLTRNKQLATFNRLDRSWRSSLR